MLITDESYDFLRCSHFSHEFTSEELSALFRVNFCGYLYLTKRGTQSLCRLEWDFIGQGMELGMENWPPRSRGENKWNHHKACAYESGLISQSFACLQLWFCAVQINTNVACWHYWHYFISVDTILYLSVKPQLLIRKMLILAVIDRDWKSGSELP